MSLKRGNLIFSGLGLFCLPLDILFLSRASQNVLIALRSTRMGVRFAGISVTIMFLLRFRAQFEFEIVELLRTAHLLFVYDHLFSLFICGFIEVSLEIVFVAVFVRLSAEFSIHIIGVIVIDRHWDRVTDCCRQKTSPKVRMEIGQDK
ncbi:BQ5605_C005g03410 [Microbotryum silenes-dioicae]|uniref:BQ5605_C005g03410 protein n=1 Tax=Microbotryum silenes-dioicae TaxID=796604 RepID=A0A2X0MF88_9BASI|nr:BQ5605_C005g03410 [Microbotryum silenes-dioicae]